MPHDGSTGGHPGVGGSAAPARPAAGTPDALAAALAGRDRYVDLLRAASLLVVVLGHWLMAGVSWSGAGGRLRTANVLGLVPAIQPLTWVLQVMPLFFFVGGYANAASWDSTRRRGGGYADFLHQRFQRLLRPVLWFLGCWLVVAAVLQVLGLGSGSAGRAARVATLIAVQPLWFIGLYALVVGLVPVSLAAHRRYGVAAPLALAAVGAGVDVLRLAAGLAYVGYLNYAVVWLFAHQLGYLYADGRLRRLRPRHLLCAAGAAIGLLVVLTGPGGYPRSMVGLPGDRISNMTPPTVCIMVLTVSVVSLALAVRGPADRWLARPRVYPVVIAANLRIMTVFLWHLTALVLVVLALYELGVAVPPLATARWWALRPVWIAGLALVLAGLVAVMSRFERPPAGSRRDPPAGPQPARALISGLAVGYVVIGLSGLALTGLWGTLADRHTALLQFSLNPALSLLHLLAGIALAAAAVRRRPDPALAGVAAGFLALAVLTPALAGGPHNVLSLNAGDAVSYLLTAAALAGALVALRRAGGQWPRTAHPGSSSPGAP